MRVHFQESGGIAFFPKMASPKTIDLETLSLEDRRALEQLVEDAKFFDLPAHLPAPRGAADCRTHKITIEDGGRRHTVTVSDPVPGPALQALIARLGALSAARPSNPK